MHLRSLVTSRICRFNFIPHFFEVRNRYSIRCFSSDLITEQQLMAGVEMRWSRSENEGISLRGDNANIGLPSLV